LFTVHIAQLAAHAADKSILCVRGGDAALPKLHWDFLFQVVCFTAFRSVLVAFMSNSLVVIPVCFLTVFRSSLQSWYVAKSVNIAQSGHVALTPFRAIPSKRRRISSRSCSSKHLQSIATTGVKTANERSVASDPDMHVRSDFLCLRVSVTQCVCRTQAGTVLKHVAPSE